MDSEVPTADSQPAPPPARRKSLPFAILLAHVFLVASFGNNYAKLRLPIGIYPTELVLGLLAVTGAGRILQVPWDRFTKLVVAFLAIGVGWVLLTGLGGSASAGAKAFSFFVYAMFYFVVRGTAVDDALRWRLLRTLGIASIVGAMIGLWQMQTGSSLFSSTAEFEVTTTGSARFVGGDYSLYGTFAAILVIVEATHTRRFNWRSAVVLTAAIAQLMLAQHRSGFVALAIALVAALALLGGSTDALRSGFKLAVLVAVGLLVAAYVFGGTYMDETLLRIEQTGNLNDENISWRLLSWYEVFDGVKDQPLGHGFAVWEFLFNIKDPLTGSHNSLLDLTYRVGVPGLFVFLALPITLFTRTRSVVQRTGAHEQLLLVVTCACTLSWLIFSSFNVVFETPYMSIFFWVFLGIGAGALHDRKA